MADQVLPTPQELAKRIRAKVCDLNDELILAALVELNVEFLIERIPEPADDTTQLRVWCSQEV